MWQRTTLNDTRMKHAKNKKFFLLFPLHSLHMGKDQSKKESSSIAITLFLFSKQRRYTATTNIIPSRSQRCNGTWKIFHNHIFHLPLLYAWNRMCKCIGGLLIYSMCTRHIRTIIHSCLIFSFNKSFRIHKNTYTQMRNDSSFCYMNMNMLTKFLSFFFFLFSIVWRLIHEDVVIRARHLLSISFDSIVKQTSCLN